MVLDFRTESEEKASFTTNMAFSSLWVRALPVPETKIFWPLESVFLMRKSEKKGPYFWGEVLPI